MTIEKLLNKRQRIEYELKYGNPSENRRKYLERVLKNVSRKIERYK